jgi:prepilin-type processing-associated H-X9-DG protein
MNLATKQRTIRTGAIAPRARSRAFTIVELFTSLMIIGILASLSLMGLTQARHIAQNATCANSLRQLGVANSLYLSDHQQKMYAYSVPMPTGRLWYFGFETLASLMSAEGNRWIDVTQSPLYPYVNQVGGIEVCPAFPYGDAIWKPKYRGASWGYGFNVFLSNVNVLTLPQPAGIMLFADCAQVNCFQAPASAKHPMLEEFYMLDATDPTIHFRHAGFANILFLDGHVEKFSMLPGTLDTRLPGVNCGRITPTGDLTYLTHAP